MTQPIPQTKPPSPGSEGVFLIDKPTGITSHDVVDRIRKITGIRRVGHAGTLDPLATGLLIILVGRKYTKQQAQFLKLDKEYRCIARLGVTTDTYDSDGEVADRADWEKLQSIDASAIHKALKSFVGEIQQTVPPFSAVKKDGKKLYELARKNELKNEKLPSKKVTIYQTKLIKLNKNMKNKTIEAELQLSVSSGTYVRSLVHDLGQQLKVGATVTKLRRTTIGKYRVDDAFVLN